ncbi:TPA: hypothetical protein ACIBXI_004922, partial [Salmonella enterica subsp. diarizonae serovar 61:l,v:z35]
MKIKHKFYTSVKIVKKPLLVSVVGVAVFAYISFSKIDIVSPGQGVITGENDKVEIKSPNSGFINKFNIREGDLVEKGMVLFSYVNLDYTYKSLILKDIISFNDERKNYLKKDSDKLNSLLDEQGFTPRPPEQWLSTEDVDLSYFAFKTEFESILMKEKNLDEKERLLNQEVQLREKQILHLQRKDSLLKKGGASDIDIMNNVSEVEQKKIELINAKINFLTLRNDLENVKSQFKIRLYD